MDSDTVIQLVTTALQLAFKVALPMLAAGLVVGVVVSVFQAVTQIQEQSLQFIPKMVAAGVVLLVAGPWMLSQILGWATELYQAIPQLVGGG